MTTEKSLADLAHQLNALRERRLSLVEAIQGINDAQIRISMIAPQSGVALMSMDTHCQVWPVLEKDLNEALIAQLRKLEAEYAEAFVELVFRGADGKLRPMPRWEPKA